MYYLLAVLAVLVMGVIVMIAGTMMIKSPGQSLQSAFDEGVAWGAGYFLSYSVVILMFELLHANYRLFDQIQG